MEYLPAASCCVDKYSEKLKKLIVFSAFQSVYPMVRMTNALFCVVCRLPAKTATCAIFGGHSVTYFLSACCVEACRRNYRCKFVDYSDLLDELIVLNRQEDLNKYRKRIRYYARIQLLFIDDFAISRYSEEGIKILYHLIKLRDDLGTSTLFTCQYSPDEWGNQLSDEKECYGKLDGIRRRLTTGFTVLIEKA